MRICVIVDGYNAGKKFPKILEKRGYKCVHVQSTPQVIKGLSKFDDSDYIATFIYQNNIENLIQEIKKIAHEQNEILCVIAGSEPGVELADSLSENLSLKTSNGTHLSKARRNKFEMREVLKKIGLNMPLYLKSNNLLEIQEWLVVNGLKQVVMKPLDSGGTDGVFICTSSLEVEKAFNSIMNKENLLNKINQAVLIESFITGKEYVVNSVSCEGIHRTNDIWVYNKKHIEGHGAIYDYEELMEFDGKIQEQLIVYTNQVLNALGIQFGPSHAEIILTEDGPVLVEIAARISGATNVEMSQDCVGHDAINLTIDSYLDPKAFFQGLQSPNIKMKCAMVVDLISNQEGIIESETLTEKLKDMKSLKSMILKVQPGNYLTKTKDLASSPAKFHLVHHDPKQIKADYNLIQEIGKNGFVLREDYQLELEKIDNAWCSNEGNIDKVQIAQVNAFSPELLFSKPSENNSNTLEQIAPENKESLIEIKEKIETNVKGYGGGCTI